MATPATKCNSFTSFKAASPLISRSFCPPYCSNNAFSAAHLAGGNLQPERSRLPGSPPIKFSATCRPRLKISLLAAGSAGGHSLRNPHTPPFTSNNPTSPTPNITHQQPPPPLSYIPHTPRLPSFSFNRRRFPPLPVFLKRLPGH